MLMAREPVFFFFPVKIFLPRKTFFFWNLHGHFSPLRALFWQNRYGQLQNCYGQFFKNCYGQIWSFTVSITSPSFTCTFQVYGHFSFLANLYFLWKFRSKHIEGKPQTHLATGHAKVPVILVIDKKRQITCPALYPRDQIVCGAFRFLLPHDYTSAEVGIFFWPTFLPIFFYFGLIFWSADKCRLFFSNFLKCRQMPTFFSP